MELKKKFKVELSFVKNGNTCEYEGEPIKKTIYGIGEISDLKNLFDYMIQGPDELNPKKYNAAQKVTVNVIEELLSCNYRCSVRYKSSETGEFEFGLDKAKLKDITDIINYNQNTSHNESKEETRHIYLEAWATEMC